MVEKYKCPVCFYPDLDEPPAGWSICPCCGTEFENDDRSATHAELRREWVDGGYRWWSSSDRFPQGWNAQEQLAQGLRDNQTPAQEVDTYA